MLAAMETEYTYTCPSCSQECSVPQSLTGQDLTCPNCKGEFFATPPEPVSQSAMEFPASVFIPPAKLPFLKSGRLKLLEQRLAELLVISSGVMTKDAKNELSKNAIALGLDAETGSKLLEEHFMRDFSSIKQRMEKSFLMTDEDVSEIEKLKTKYDIRLTLEGTADLFRQIYLLESTGQLPSPLQTDLMLDGNESAFYSIPTVWHQARVQSHGYSGSSVSVPTGIKGVRFNFGGYTPIKSEEITALSSGTLYVTSKRLLFNGDSRNTTITLKKLIDGHIYSDCLKVEKSSGKPDYFTMQPPEARYILALVGVLK
jgi:hypothetical protein